MNTQSATEKRMHCPACGGKGRRVGRVTLRALLQGEYAKQIAPAEPTRPDTAAHRAEGCHPAADDTGWRFCGSPDCDVVYFAEDADTVFVKSQLRVPVGIKEKAGERPLCYCFGHSIASIKEELRTKGRSDALEDIRRKMKAPGCRCEMTNPSGSCCLGSVAAGIKIAREELKMEDAPIEDVESEGGPSSAVVPNSSSGQAEKVAKIGTLVSAVMASSCCWLPLLLLAVGVSATGVASTLEAYRPVFIVVTFAFLAAAFYFTYRPRRAVADEAHDCCSPPPAESAEDCCATPAKGRLSMVALNKVMLWVVTAMAVAFLLFPSYVGALLGGSDGNTVTPAMSRTVVNVEGMTCEGCADVVEKAMGGVPGVLAVEVDYQKGQAIVGTEACCPVPREEILAALEESGYKGSFPEPRAGAAQSGSRTVERTVP